MTHIDPHRQRGAALAASRRGWLVFPLVPGGKRPAVAQWERRASTSATRIARCWQHAPYNIGLATGPSGLVVIDLDVVKPGEAVPDGASALAVLCAERGTDIPETFTVATPSGGTHLYFTAPEGVELRNTAGKLAPKIDTRAVGGYVVAPGSQIDGRSYVVVIDAPVAPLPTWVAALLVPPSPPPQRPMVVSLAATDRRSAYLRAAVTAELERVRTGSEAHGGRNNALYVAAVALGQLVAGGELSEPPGES